MSYITAQLELFIYKMVLFVPQISALLFPSIVPLESGDYHQFLPLSDLLFDSPAASSSPRRLDNHSMTDHLLVVTLSRLR